MLLLLSALLEAQTIKFTEVAFQLGVPGNTIRKPSGKVVSYLGHGVAMADINNDGVPDIYISNAVRYANKLPETLYVSKNGQYVEEDKARGIDDPYGWTGSHGICFFDYDNDGDYDLYNATTDDRNRLYRNDGNGYFTDVTDAARLPLIRVVYPPFDSQPYGYGTRGVIAFDADNDGYLDLLAVNWGPAENRYDSTKIIVIPPQPNEFYRNNGNGTFTPVDNGLTLPANHSYMGTQGVVAADVDNDGDMDVLIVHRNYTAKTESGEIIAGFNEDYQIPNQLMINDGTGRFTDETKKRNLFDIYNDANGATFADYDNDGDLDLFVPPKKKNNNLRVFRNNGRGIFSDVTNQLKIEQWGFSTFIFDVDNDGDLDIIAPKTESITNLYLNNGNGTFALKTGTGLEIYNKDPRGGAVGDIDGDGDLDLYIADANKVAVENGGNRLFRNDLVSTNRWLRIVGRGPRGDLGGFGTKIWVFEKGYCGDMSRLVGYRQIMNAYGYLCQDDPVQHFGIGQRDSVDVQVRLLDGTTLKMLSAPAKTQLFFSRPSQVTAVEGDPQNAPAGSELPQPLQVQVHDRFGNPVYGAKVIFSSNDPAAQFLPSATVYTQRDGTASVRYRVGSAGQFIVTASIEEEPANRATFTITGTPSMTIQMSKLSGDGQTGYTGQLLPQPLRVLLMRQNGNPASGVTVNFSTVSGQATFEPAAAVASGADGIASVNVRLGNTEGEVVIHAEVENALNSPLVFRAQAQALTLALTKVAGDGQSAVVGTTLPLELEVRTTYIQGGPAPNVPVNFIVNSGGGNINGLSGVTVLSDAQGSAKVRWTLGTTAGTQNVTASAGGLSVQFTAQALADRPYRLSEISGSGQTLVPGQPFAVPFVVSVNDRFNNPNEGVQVIFRVTRGTGHVGGMTEKVVVTDAAGRASVIWTPDPYQGAPNELQAICTPSGEPVQNSPLVWSYPAADISAALSTVTATSPVWADGEDRSEVTVTLRNSQNQPAGPGYTVQISVSGSDNQVTYVNEKSDDQSVVRAYVTSTTPGSKTVTAKVLGANVTASSQPVIEFLNAQQVPDRLILLSGNGQSGVVNQPLAQPFVIKAVDIAGLPMRRYDVTFTVTAGDGHFDGRSSVTVRTAADGLASALLTLGRTAGVRTYVRVTATGMSNSPMVLYADNRAAEPQKLVIATGDQQVGSPNAVLPVPLTVRVTDLFDNPVSGVHVTFKVNSGSCTLDGLQQKVVATDEQGKAQVYARLGAVGRSIVEARTDFAVVAFSLTAIDNRPVPDRQKSTLVCTSPVPADGLSRSSVVVTLLDQKGNPVPGRGVRIEAIGEAVTVTQADSLSDLQGRVRGYLTSTVPGVKLVLAYLTEDNSLLEQRGLVEFRQGQPLMALLAGDGQSGVVGRPLPEPLRVRVSSDGFPLFGRAVQFIVLSGGGTFGSRESVTIDTDTLGIAAAEFIPGTLAGLNRVKAALVGTEQNVIFTVHGRPDEATQLSRDAGEGQSAGLRATLPQKLRVTARDRYNNPAPQTPITFEAVDGGAIITPQPVLSDSLGKAEAVVALGEREGRYTFKASLPNGTAVLFTATAVNTNRAPVIVSYRPLETTLSFSYGERLQFEILEVMDPDGDSISYEWNLNGRRVGDRSSLAVYMNPSFPETNVVRCRVSDGLASIEITWTLTLRTGVQVTAFSAQPVTGKGVELYWQASGKALFDLLRIREGGREQRLNSQPLRSTDGAFRFIDTEPLPPGRYTYCLRTIEGDRTYEAGRVTVTVAVPEEFSLLPNFPNPFNPTTTIAFNLPAGGHAAVVIYDNTGRRVRCLFDDDLPAGTHRLTWDARNDEGEAVASGLYFVTITFDGRSLSRKLTLLK